MPRSQSCSPSSRCNPTRKSGRNWCGKSRSAWRRISRGRFSTTTVPALAGIRMSKATRRWSTASTTATGWKTSGSTNNREGAWKMQRIVCLFIAVGALIVANPAVAQKPGGVLKMYFCDSPASMSIHEEATIAGQGPMMGVFNNLVMYDQHIAQTSINTIVPDLASEWSWDEDKTGLTFKLRQGVKWHDGKPFTAKDVKCTWDLLQGKSADKLRLNPRKAWYRNLEEVVPNGDYEVTFRLKRPQPAFIALLASGFSPVYPCHVSAKDMRQHPIGTGPFKFVEFKPNEGIKLVRNPDYWKKDRPYLDGIEYTIIRNMSTAILAYVSGKFDMAFPYSLTVPLLKDVKRQMPQAMCEMGPVGLNRNLIVNRDKPPFDSPDLRRAMALSLDRRAFIDILTEGQGDIGGVLQPPPGGLWGLPPEQRKELPGYDPDVEKNRKEARALMEKAGYGPDKRVKVK